MRTFSMGLAVGLFSLATQLTAWQDPFQAWTVGGYAQAWGLGRPETGMPRSGVLDDSSREAGGWRLDGFFVRRLEVRLAGGLGWDGWSARLGTQTDLRQYGLADAAVQWQVAPGLSVQGGQLRLPFGQEQQLSSGKLPSMQRSLVWGLQNMGHVEAWGFGLLSERGQGLRLDWKPQWGAWKPVLELGAFNAKGNTYYSLLGGGGRAALAWENGGHGLGLGASVHVGRARWAWQAGAYEGLGQDLLRKPGRFKVDDLGRPTVLTWGQDASLDLGPLHGRAELALQSAGPWLRGGHSVLGWMDLPILAGSRFYGRAEQGSSTWADGVHIPGALYQARTLGLELGISARQRLFLERFELFGDDLVLGFAGQIWQAQWQLSF